MSKSKSGFTLVELLIVIVIISILATITVVAYNGITDRARKVTIKNDLSNAAKNLQIYAVDTTRYPQNVNELMGGDRPPLRKNVFARNPDPYTWVVYCADDNEFVIAARQADTNPQWWAAVGSKMSLQEVSPTGMSSSASVSCTTLLGHAPVYSNWVKANAGWSASLK